MLPEANRRAASITVCLKTLWRSNSFAAAEKRVRHLAQQAARRPPMCSTFGRSSAYQCSLHTRGYRPVAHWGANSYSKSWFRASRGFPDLMALFPVSRVHRAPRDGSPAVRGTLQLAARDFAIQSQFVICAFVSDRPMGEPVVLCEPLDEHRFRFAFAGPTASPHESVEAIEFGGSSQHMRRKTPVMPHVVRLRMTVHFSGEGPRRAGN